MCAARRGHDTSSSGNLIGRTVTNYDDRSRVYQSVVYAVDPGTGTVGNALTTNKWYAPSGNLQQTQAAGDGQVFSKQLYNGVYWVTGSYRGYNLTGTSSSQAATVAGNNIISQVINAYDEVGNVVSTASYDRLNDAPSTGSGTHHARAS